MSRSWFWIKFSLLMIFSAFVGMIALPNSVKEHLPEMVQEKVSEYQLKLGMDLSGGTIIDYQVDFSEAEKRAADSLRDNNESNDIIIDKKQISEGVVKTLKKRIDPDGTKEVVIFASKRGENWFVIVELPLAIDTPENREKLTKVTSLEFKEPHTITIPATTGQKEKATEVLTLLSPLSKKTPGDLTSVYSKIEELKLAPIKIPNLEKEELLQYFGAEAGEKIWNAPENSVHSEIVENEISGRNLIIVKEKVEEEEEGTDENNETVFRPVTRIAIEAIRFNDSPEQTSTEWISTGLGGAQFRVAKVTQDQEGKPATSISFDTEGTALFGEITGRLAERTTPECGNGDRFAIFVDGEIISAPCVHERLDRNAIITGNKDTYQNAQADAQKLADDLNSGATPAPIEFKSERKVSASLGESSFHKSINAALIGFLLVALWMIGFYRFFGVLAIVALVFYAAVLIAILKSASFLVLTLSGIAGIILSIGMAVDANILIFERIREELQAGRKYADAVEEGFERAWTSIKDSNVSSLITCFILWGLGTTIIKAFAITLAIGIIISMFTAITFTWYLVKVFVPKYLEKKQCLLIGGKKSENTEEEK